MVSTSLVLSLILIFFNGLNRANLIDQWFKGLFKAENFIKTVGCWMYFRTSAALFCQDVVNSCLVGHSRTRSKGSVPVGRVVLMGVQVLIYGQSHSKPAI